MMPAQSHGCVLSCLHLCFVLQFMVLQKINLPGEGSAACNFGSPMLQGILSRRRAQKSLPAAA